MVLGGQFIGEKAGIKKTKEWEKLRPKANIIGEIIRNINYTSKYSDS